LTIYKDKQFQSIISGLLLIIFLRFFYLQVYQHQKHEDRAGSNSIRKISLHAPRGIIFDSSGIPLVDNREIYDLAVIPFDVTDKFNYDIITQKLKLPTEEVMSIIAQRKKSFYRFRPQIIKRHINFETRSQLEENKLDLPGMFFEKFPARIYPNDANLTHVLGYLRTITDQAKKRQDNDYKMGDIYGFSGVEKVYESSLRGKDGIEYHLVDIYGIDHGIVVDIPPISSIPGKPLHLTIDSKLQFYIEKLFEGKQGAVICMHPLSGQVLAYLSAPDYDLNSFVGPVPRDIWDTWNQDDGHPLLNRGIQGLYPPGSTMKLIAAALTLEQEKINEKWIVNCSGAYTLGDRTFHCWNAEGHGKVNLQQAITHSCNIYFYQLIQKLSFADWKEMAENFGYGRLSGIDLYGEVTGNIPGIEYMNKKYGKYGWATGNLLTFVIGQGDVLVTPIQVVQMMNLIATRGNTHAPGLNINNSSNEFNLHLKSSTWDFLQDAIWNVVNQKDGTGKLARIEGADIHGKTGTAQNPHGEDHSWFTGYMAIDNNPVISLVVLVEHGGKGSIEGAVISRKIFEFVLQNELIQ